MENLKITDRQDKGLLAGNGKWKKIFSAIPNVVDDLAREANQLFDYSAGKNARTIAIEQNRIKNPLWNNTGLFHYMNNTRVQTLPQKRAGLIDPNAFKFVLLLGVAGFVIYKLLPTSKPQEKINE